MNSIGAEMIRAMIEAYERSLEKFENENNDNNDNAENEEKEN